MQQFYRTGLCCAGLDWTGRKNVRFETSIAFVYGVCVVEPLMVVVRMSLYLTASASGWAISNKCFGVVNLELYVEFMYHHPRSSSIRCRSLPPSVI